VREHSLVPQAAYQPAVWADEIEESDYKLQEHGIIQAEGNEPFTKYGRGNFEPELFDRKDDDLETLEGSISSSVLTLENRENDNKQDFVLKKNVSNKTRQLEAIAFPVGIAIGAIGAALWPAIFPGRNNENDSSTSTTTQRINGDQENEDTDNFESSTPSSSTTTTTFKPRSVLADFPDCGVKGSSNRVVGGTEVVENEYPWLCSLKYNDNHICGMTLISGPPHETILVGAAHCFSAGDNVYSYRITCGEHSLRGRGKYEVTLQVIEVIVHPKYIEASTSGFDIAVYKVTDAPLHGKMVEKRLWPACLPDLDRDYLRETTYVAGWGITKTKFIRGTKIDVKGIPDIARHTSVIVKECKDDDNFDYPKGLICASESGQDSCQGDSGGPLIGRSSKHSGSLQKRYSWIGIVSFGVGCAQPGFPGAYSRSSCFLGFIAEQFGLKADFTFGNEHPGWSTDCPNGGSRRSSSIHRRKNRDRNQDRKKNKNRNKSHKGRDTLVLGNGTDIETTKMPDVSIEETTKTNYVSRDKIITISDLENKFQTENSTRFKTRPEVEKNESSESGKTKKNKMNAKKEEKRKKRLEKKNKKKLENRNKNKQKRKEKLKRQQSQSQPIILGYKTNDE